MSLLCVQIRHLKRPPQGMNARPIRNSPPYRDKGHSQRILHALGIP